MYRLLRHVGGTREGRGLGTHPARVKPEVAAERGKSHTTLTTRLRRCRLVAVFGGTVMGIAERMLRRQKHRPTTPMIVPNSTLAMPMLAKTSMVTLAPAVLTETFATT